ncbi:hypothetical protein H8F21_13690 [Pseudomonas sp. P66]|uniref:Uncharacterized protein n=1 Tax=Pseudomonas arcuscaelestis TaxID=2710591 RepID=A0ABS2BYC7_9PSED|nr:hypothetical protein [Pseudomonas arcuscaelestis]MBM5458617.1 hypothetical protein [Pseudomonas arcuscaelestis]
MKQSINLPIGHPYVDGKSSGVALMAREFMRPKGQWKQFWTRHLLNISPDSRLPRGFSPKLVDEVSLRICDEAPASPSWMDLNKDSIAEAVQMLTPAAPVKKPARKKPKPAVTAVE